MFMLAAGAGTAWGQLDPNDPSPKFGHDERNTCYTANRGPHSKPQLRWWAYLESPTGSQVDHLRGVVVARLGQDNKRYVLVGTRESRVDVFRFHPDAQHLDELTLEAQPVSSLVVIGPVNSTPVVMPNDWVAVQTTGYLEVWNLANPASPTRLWYAALSSYGNSPAFGPMLAAGGYGYLYVQGNGGKLYCIDPDQTPGEDGSVNLETASEWYAVLSPSLTDQGRSAPAIGPIADDPYYDPRNFVYASTYSNAGEDHLFALYADGSGCAWSHPVNCWGTYASPSVHHSGRATVGDQVVIGSDWYALYGFYNECQAGQEEFWPRRWTFSTGMFVSGTAGLTPDGNMIVMSETPQVYDLTDQGSYVEQTGSTYPDLDENWVDGTPVLDSAGRFYLATPGLTSSLLGCMVLAYDRPLEPSSGPDDDPNEPVWSWGASEDMPVEVWDEDPEHRIYVPRLRFCSPCATDVDGTFLCASFGYLFALRPVLADFNGDGLANNFDITPLGYALGNPTEWDARWGAVHGINLLGVGDANNDGAFNNFDIGLLVQEMLGGDNSNATAEDWSVFLETVIWIYDHFQAEEGS